MSVTPTDMALLCELGEGCKCDAELCHCSIRCGASHATVNDSSLHCRLEGASAPQPA